MNTALVQQVIDRLQAWSDDALLKQLHADGGSQAETRQGNLHSNYDALILKLQEAIK